MAQFEKRAQLYLAKEQFQKVVRLAKEKHTSFAQVIRESIEELLRKSQTKWDHDSISKHIGIFEGKETELSKNHDQTLYDE